MMKRCLAELQLLIYLTILSNVTSQFLSGPSPFGGPGPPMPLPGPAPGPPMMPSFPGPMAPFSGLMPAFLGPMAPFPGPMPPFPGPMSFPILPQRKLPVVMMPYHSKKTDKLLKWHKKRLPKRPHRKHCHHSTRTSSDTSSSSSDSSDDFDFRTHGNSKFRRKRRRQVLTPMVSYVKKNGDVVYQKKIKKERAKDWLNIGRLQDVEDNVDEASESGERIKKWNAKLKRKKKRHHKH